MLPRKRRGRCDVACCAAHQDGLANKMRLAALLAGDGLRKTKVVHLRVIKDLSDVVNLTHRDAGVIQNLDPLCGRGSERRRRPGG